MSHLSIVSLERLSCKTHVDACLRFTVSELRSAWVQPVNGSTHRVASSRVHPFFCLATLAVILISYLSSALRE